jgi:lipoprotein-anchoring transpeptidase ErfK/SrfK
MKPDNDSAQQYLLNARQCLQRGELKAARQWAQQAAALGPDLEEPWLILAAVASPRASVGYLEKALRINPNSEHARKGMHWAVDRLRKESVHPVGEAIPSKNKKPVQISQVNSDLDPILRSRFERKLPLAVAQAAPVPLPPSSKSLANYRWSFLTLLLLGVCLTLAWVLWPGNASPGLAFLHGSQSTLPAFSAPIELDKPTYTPTFTPTLTATNTFTPTPTFTLTPSPTETVTPSETYTPSRTPLPTNTPKPTRKPLPSNTPRPWPTNTPYMGPGYNSERWIDVDLSQQMLYAYEGDNIVASFLISSGVPAFPTVTGQYHIYVKLITTLMAGDGYYLPDVPYTMYFYKGYGLHGTYWHNNFGVPMSHGCVNMYTPDAEWLFYWASVGTLVNIHY